MMAWGVACPPAEAQLNVVSGTVASAQNCDPTALGDSIESRLITSSLPFNFGVSDIGGLIYGSEASAFVTFAGQTTIFLPQGGWIAGLTSATNISWNGTDYGLVFEIRPNGMVFIDASLPVWADQYVAEDMSLNWFDYRRQDICHQEVAVLEVASFVPGDTNMDGTFDSSDFVDVMTKGEYEDTVTLNSSWETGDWNGDREFTFGDLLWAAAYGAYADAVRFAPRSVPEPIGGFWLYFLFACAVGRTKQAESSVRRRI